MGDWLRIDIHLERQEGKDFVGSLSTCTHCSPRLLVHGSELQGRDGAQEEAPLDKDREKERGAWICCGGGGSRSVEQLDNGGGGGAGEPVDAAVPPAVPRLLHRGDHASREALGRLRRQVRLGGHARPSPTLKARLCALGFVRL